MRYQVSHSYLCIVCLMFHCVHLQHGSIHSVRKYFLTHLSLQNYAYLFITSYLLWNANTKLFLPGVQEIQHV